MSGTHLAAAGFEDGAAAYERGDYDAALREWRPLAESGNQQAQYNIGYMHFNGIGVPKEPAQATRWFAMAAEQGDPAAQMSLGVMYGTGQGVPQDYTQAYIWLTLAAARLPYGEDRDQAVKNRDIVSAKMSRDQITEALGKALNWTPKARSGEAVPVTASTPPGPAAAPVAQAAPAPAAPAPASVESPSGSAGPGSQIAAAGGKSPPAPAVEPAPVPVTVAPSPEPAPPAEKPMEPVAKAPEAPAPVAATSDPPPAVPEPAAPEPAAPEPVPAAPEPVQPPPQTAALTSGGGYVVQLASLRSMDAAKNEWARLQRSYADVFSGLEPILQAVDLGSRGNFVRVQVGPFTDATAREVCRQLKSRSQDCVVVAAAKQG